MTTTAALQQTSRRALIQEITGGHVLVAMLLFFGLIIAMNIAFSVVAVRSFPGEDERRSYLQGLHYNDTLAERAAQRQLGWGASMEMTARGRSAELRVRFVEKNGRPIDGLTIAGRLRRPATTRADRPITFTALGDGLYVVDAGNLAPGGWIFQGLAARGTQRFEFERRMTWAPSSPR